MGNDTQALTLTEFLLARIEEDEEVARRSSGSPLELTNRNAVSGTDAVRSAEAMVEHIARHDPARVLAECEAKRRIVERYVDTSYIEEHPSNAYDLALFHVMCDLALPYTDHPDYRDEWRP